MTSHAQFSLGIVGAGQFSGQFAKLFKAHPGISSVHVTDLLPERAAALSEQYQLDGTYPSFEAMLASDLDAVAIFTQRWTHGPLVVQALEAGKHVYSAVPMAVAVDQIEAIIAKVQATGLTYMMGETSYYNPATVYARGRVADTVRQAQTMDLADHGIAGHTAQFLGDLAGRLSFGPHAFQRLDALIGPGHGLPFLHRGRTRCPSLW